MNESNGLSILLRAKLAETQDTINDINKQIQNLSNNKLLEKLKIKIEVDNDALLNVSKRIKEIQDQLGKGFGNPSPTSKPKILPELDPNEIENRVQKINNAIARLQVGKDKVFTDTGVKNELTKMQDMLTSFSNGGNVSVKDLGLQFDNLRTKVTQVSGSLKNVNKDGYSFTQMTELAAKKIAIWGDQLVNAPLIK